MAIAYEEQAIALLREAKQKVEQVTQALQEGPYDPAVKPVAVTVARQKVLEEYRNRIRDFYAAKEAEVTERIKRLEKQIEAKLAEASSSEDNSAAIRRMMEEEKVRRELVGELVGLTPAEITHRMSHETDTLRRAVFAEALGEVLPLLLQRGIEDGIDPWGNPVPSSSNHVLTSLQRFAKEISEQARRSLEPAEVQDLRRELASAREELEGWRCAPAAILRALDNELKETAAVANAATWGA